MSISILILEELRRTLRPESLFSRLGGWRGGFKYARQHLFSNTKAKEQTALWLQHLRKQLIAESSLPL
jgi:hypothetical protein